MRITDVAWLAFGLVVALGYGAANVFAWDPGAIRGAREHMPAAGSHRPGGFHTTYWSTGFGGK